MLSITIHPADRVFVLALHALAQDLDEQHLGQLGQDAGAAGPAGARLGQGVAHRGLQPRPGLRSLQRRLHYRRQASQPQPAKTGFAGHEAAHHQGGRAAAAIADQRRLG